MLLWPLMRRVLVPSAQLTYQSVPAVVPTTPMSMLLWKTALTMAPSRVSSRSMNTELDLGGEQWVQGGDNDSPGSLVLMAASLSLGLGCTQACPHGGQAQLAMARWPAALVKDTSLAHLAPEPLRLSSGTAPTAHRRSRLVLLPLTSREPAHSSTPRRKETA